MYRKMFMISAIVGTLVLQGCTVPAVSEGGKGESTGIKGMNATEVSLAGDNVLSTEVDVTSRQCIESVTTDFIYRLCVEREVYKEGESVPVIGELEYKGDKESVTIAHAASPFYYDVRDTANTYGFVFVMAQPLLHTTLRPGEPLLHVYSGVQAYAKGEENNPIGVWTEAPFPAGEYEIRGEAEFELKRSADEDDEEEYKIASGGKLTIIVEE
ncbi:hypothetical protein [Paenibacillus chungangensis]|uniref:Lipoprotein n=1 Tax=Paenibacillus chungangensis TaxID=696535 RepID=A0ABW3HS99_9BACL